MPEIDQAIITIGPPKCGKTTLVRGACITFLGKHQRGIALVHDVNRQFVDLCAPYETVAQWRAARVAAKLENRAFPRGASITGYSEARAIVEAVIELGAMHNTAQRVALPMFVAFDETSMMEDSSSTHIARHDLQMLTTRRHLGVAPAYNLQRGGALMKAFYEASTDVFVFRQSSEESAREIEIKLGVQKGSLRCMLSAENFRYAHWKNPGGLC